jgi:hypothetical protein
LSKFQPRFIAILGRSADTVEFEYIRHGTQTLIGNFEVATGQVISPTIEETRTEQDFVGHICATVEAGPKRE